MKVLARSMVCGLMLGAVTAIGLASSAGAAVYPPAAPVIVVVPVAAGTVNVNGTGWTPGDVVTVTVQSDPVLLGTIVVGASGTFSQNFPIPCSIGNGAHVVTATGTSGTASTAITVSDCAVSPAVPLAFTGSSSAGPFAGVGVGLVLVGIVFAVTAQRRRSAHMIKV